MQIGDIVQGLAAGVGVDLSPDGKTAYYVEWSIGELNKVEVDTGKVTALQPGLSYPEDVEVDWDTGQIFVSERTGAIRRVWPGERSEVIAKPGGAPHQLALVKQGGKRILFMVCFDSGKLVAIDVDTKAMKTIATGLRHPIGLVIDASKKLAYVTEQDTASLTRVKLVGGIKKLLYTGLISPFFLAWDKTKKTIFCVQRDPANNLVKLKLGPSVTLQSVATGLAWRPSGVGPNVENTKIYICADQKLQVIAFDGAPHIQPGPAPFEIHSLEFNYDESSAITLKDHISGNLIQRPEFIKGSRNEPAAYVAGTLPKIKVVLRKLPGYVGGTYAIGAIGNLGGVRRKHLTPVFQSSGLSDPIEFNLMWPLPGTVGKPNVSLDWYARKTGGPAVPALVGSAKHKMYLTADWPVGPWQAETPWIGALEVACEWAAGAANTDMVAAGITRGLNSCSLLDYTPMTMFGWNSYLLSQFLQKLQASTGFVLNCTDCADAVVTLSNLLGCDLWEGRMTSLKTRPILGIGGNPVVQSDWRVWNWNYHEIGWLHAIGPNEFIWDGCLQLDLDTNDTDTVHIPCLPVKMKFANYYRLLTGNSNYTLENISRRRPVV
jgi:hypothetical protein